MSGFHTRSFQQRFGQMGDLAESMFDKVYPKHHKLGLERPPFFMGGMPQSMRCTPDRMLRDRMVECMGVGRDRKLKVKADKLEGLAPWPAVGPVHLFVYDSWRHEYYEAPLADWVRQLDSYGIARTFENDGKAYTELDVANFPTLPRPIPEDDDAA